MNRIPIIIDTDIGSDIDDTWALALALASGRFDIRLITTVCEDVQYKATLADKLCAAAGKRVPVVAGCGGPVVCSAQKAWLSGEDKPYSRDLESSFAGVVGQTPGVTVVALGPFTNLARVLAARPDLAGKFRIVAMIGAVEKGYLGEAGPGPECNAALDPKSFNAVLASGVDTEILPLDVCRDFVLDKDCYRLVYEACSPLARAVIENYKIWHRDYVGGAVKSDPETASTILFDLLPILRLIFPEEFVTRRICVRADEAGRTIAGGDGFEVTASLALRDKERLIRLAADILTGGDAWKNC